MKSLRVQSLVSLLGISLVYYSCELSELESRDSYLDLPIRPFEYNIGVKDELPTLGRVLFYDPRISANNAVSCGSCHKQELAFSDGRQFSVGFMGGQTNRNSMSIQNIVSTAFPVGVQPDSTGSFRSTSLFWDGRQPDILNMVLEPIQNHVEMGVNNLNDLENKVRSISDYKSLFKGAFGSEEINKDKIATALSAFIVSIKSINSRFDLSSMGNIGLNQQELIGSGLFFNTYDCNSCHQLQQPFNGYQLGTQTQTVGAPDARGLVDIGLDENPTDDGAFRNTGVPSDIGKFKIASLRNVALTAPYMHDGRFKTLEDVIDHYSTGIRNSSNLDGRLKNADGTPKKLNIPYGDKVALVAFLNTLTDRQLLHAERFSNPFKVN